MADTEKIRTMHHPAPWLPEGAEIEFYSSSRARMACPDQGEDLFHRYRKILAGLSGIRFSDADYLAGFAFERALTDLTACEVCHVTDYGEVVIGERADAKLRVYGGCRTMEGRGMFLDLDRRKTLVLGRPVFAVRNCTGSADRLAELLELFSGRRIYEREEPLVRNPLIDATAHYRAPKKGGALIA